MEQFNAPTQPQQPKTRDFPITFKLGYEEILTDNFFRIINYKKSDTVDGVTTITIQNYKHLCLAIAQLNLDLSAYFTNQAVYNSRDQHVAHDAIDDEGASDLTVCLDLLRELCNALTRNNQL